MSLFKYMFDNEWLQRQDIEDLKLRSRAEARRNRRARNTADRRLEELEDEVDQLEVIVEALLELLTEHHGLDAERLQAAIARAQSRQRADAAEEEAAERAEQRSKAPRRTRRRT